MIAFQVGARATRDAYFLSNYPATMLPPMMMATSILAVALAYASTRAFRRWGPELVMPAAFLASAALLVAEWAVSFWSPGVASVLVYLHYGCLGALLISGFYSFMNERFDPRTAKRQLGRIAAAGTIGGLLGGLAAAQVSNMLPVTAMLPVLAAFHLVCALGVIRLRSVLDVVGGHESPRAGATRDSGASGVRALAATPYIRSLITLVLLVTMAEGLLDLALKGRASAAFGGGAELLRFFAVFYTGVALLTVVAQAAASRLALEKLGPARAAALLPASVAVAAAGAAIVPGLTSAVIARGTESVLANSLYRAGYEVLFTPVPARDKRTIKSLVDVGASRAGDLLAAGIAQAIILLALPVGTALVVAATLVALCGVVVAWRLHGGYVLALARGLVSRAVHLDLSGVNDATTRATLMQTMGAIPIASRGPDDEETGESKATEELLRIRDLRGRDATKVRRALRAGPLTADHVPHVVPLLAWDEVARDAIDALRGTGADAVEPLVTSLLDPTTDFAIRRRIPLVLGACPDRRAVDGLLRGLADKRFEVRYRSGRGLAHLLDKDAMLWVSPKDAFEAVLREIDAASGVWEGRSLLDRMDDEEWSPVMGELVRERANRSLEHVFTLLALVLPRKPLRIAFQGLHTEDRLLRATALEYLESSLPPQIRKPLWPYLEDNRPKHDAAARPTEEALDALLKSNDSISLKLEELRGKGPDRNPEG